MIQPGRYDRQTRIPGWNQPALENAYILIAGAGALGNEIIKNLALAGTGHLLIVDYDRVELSNLSRTVLFSDKDTGSYKAEVAAQAAKELNPGIDIRFINGDILYSLGLGFYRHATLVISGLDNLEARLQVGRSCALAGTPFLDGGMWDMGGEVRWFLPGKGPCFDCTITSRDQERLSEHRSCTGLAMTGPAGANPPMPAAIGATAVTGGLLAQEALKYLCGREVKPGEFLVYNGLKPSLHKALLEQKPNCFYHHPYPHVIQLDYGVDEISAKELLDIAEEKTGKPCVLSLGRDLVIDFHCPHCNRREDVYEVAGKIDESQQVCTVCGKSREARIISRLDGKEPYCSRQLSQLKIPPGEVLCVAAGEELNFFEFTGDIKKLWQSI